MASLAAVVQGYLTMAEKKTEAAKQEAIDKVFIIAYHQQLWLK